MKANGISWGVLLLAGMMLSGCASISESAHRYLGSPKYPPTNPANVQVLQREPKRQKEALGEVLLIVHGNPPEQKLEEKLRQAAARFGADAVFIATDRTEIIPVLYVDYWWGPQGMSEDVSREIIGVAIKYK